MDRESASKFLNQLYAGKADDNFLVVWTLSTKRSRFFLDIEEAAAFAAEQSRDVYIGCGLSPQDYGEFARPAADQIAAIPGFWIDLDVAHADPRVHKKEKLPPDQGAALKILEKLPFKPTLVVDSGYGLQAWWLFREPWTFEDSADRDRAAVLSQKWHQLFIQTSQSFGYEGDSLADLSRILRIAGTLNCKIPDEPKPVSVRWGKTERRFNPSDFEEVIGDIERAGGLEAPRATRPAGPWDGKRDWSKGANVGLLFGADRQPPIEKFQALRKSSRKFANTCEHKRTDMKDTSSSAYDQALALLAVRAGWSDQEIADLMQWHQSKFPPRLGPRRPMYFRLTIERARQYAAPDPSIQRLRESQQQQPQNGKVLRMPSPGPAPADSEPGPRAPKPAGSSEHGDEPPPPPPPFDALKELSMLFGIKITRIVKQLSQPPLYTVDTDRGNVFLGTVNNLIEQRALRNALATIGVYLKKRKEDDWEPIAQALLDAVTPVEVTSDATTAGIIAAWIRDYLRDSTVCQSIEEADENSTPFLRESQLWLFSTGLRKYLITMNGERNLTSHELCNMLREYGAVPKTVGMVKGGEKTTRSVWTLPGTPAGFGIAV